ncbi:MAG: hypothetical protein U9P90_03415 [Patescibacteria group bacterium]|nr:hypothetical protein [Patescibacteria group bacterium]
MAEGDKIDTVKVVVECDFCKNKKKMTFVVYENSTGELNLERFVKFLNHISFVCPKCGANGQSGFTIGVKLSNKILNHQNASHTP